uniref:Craniofacial development protein 1 n=1 Tax=Ciona savignyi TaxID=51511 RepID=H2ZLR0_CIOSA
MSSNEDEHSSEDEDYVPNDAEHSGSDGEDDKGENSSLQDVENKHKEESEKDTGKVDEIWKSFKEDTKIKKNDQLNIAENDNTKQNAEQIKTDEKQVQSEKHESLENKDSSKDTVTITKVYDFAGEDVKVTKEVKKNSKEALEHLKTTGTNGSTPGKSGISGFKKRAGGGISNVLGKLGKKPKLSTLEKSKLDWDRYKEEEGIEDELKTYNKGKQGYLEKVSFLERTDMRQFQNERDLRQKISRR